MEAARSVIGADSGEQRGQRRSIHLDNAKVILIALVVFGSLLELGLLGTRAGEFVYLFIFLFHMPAFAFVSGVLSRPDAYTRSGARKLLSLAGVYVFFQCAYIAMQHFRTGEFSYHEAVVYPTWVLWYLVSLISWRLMLPLLARGRSYRAAFVSIAVAVVLAVASGLLLVDGGVFSLSQTFVFLPFFVSGFWVTRLSVRMPRDRRVFVLALAAFSTAAVLLAWDNTLVREGWLHGRATFSQIGGSVWEDGVKRLLLLGFSGVLVAAFMRLVPRRPTALSGLGKTTLSIYVWHGLAIWMVSALGLDAAVGGSFLGVALATIAVLVVFGVGPVPAITLRLAGSSSAGPTIDGAARRGHLLGVAIVSAFTASLIGKAYLTRLLVAHDSSVLRAVALEGPLLFVLVAGVYALTRHRPRLAVLALSATTIALSFTMAATAVYAAYFGQVLTPQTVMLAGEAAGVGTSIADLLRPVHLLYAVDVPLMVLAAILIGRSRSDERSPEVRPAAARLAVATLCALLIASVPLLSAWWLPENVDSVVAVRKRGVLAYQLLGLPALAEATPADAPVGQLHPDDVTSEIERLRGGDAGPRIAAFTPGAYRGKNLIVVQMESVMSFMVDLEVDGVEVMPNLSRLASESWYFPRTYAQIGRGNTSDAEFVMNTGLYPPIDQAAAIRWAAKTLPSLPRLLDAQGYRTATMHANTARFWNRTELYPALGFDEYYDREAIGEPQWGWGASDEVTFDFAVSLMKGLRADGDPFYAQIVTLTSHTPYDYPPAEQRPYTPSVAFAGTKVGVVPLVSELRRQDGRRVRSGAERVRALGRIHRRLLWRSPRPQATNLRGRRVSGIDSECDRPSLFGHRFPERPADHPSSCSGARPRR